MRPIQRIISVGFATAAFASAAMPILSVGGVDADGAGSQVAAASSPAPVFARAQQPLQIASAEPTLGGPTRR